MAFDNEHVLVELESRLQSQLAAALDTIEAEWASTDPVTLPDVVTWFRGHKPTVLELPSTAFPFVALIGAGRRPGRVSGYVWGYQGQSPTIYVDWFVVAADEATVNKRCSRYAQAVLSVLQSQSDIYGYSQKDYEPQIDLSEASRHAQTASADMFDSSQVDFIQMGRVTVEFGDA